jgi:hypothetical protein
MNHSSQPRTPGGSVLSAIPWLPNTQFTKIRLRELFNEFDKDNNNVIDMSELQDFAYSLGEVWSNETCQKIFDKLDTDKSGGLDIDEFSAWFLTPGAVDEVSKDDDFFTKFALGPELFLRRAQRKASEATKLLGSHSVLEGVLIRSPSSEGGGTQFPWAKNTQMTKEQVIELFKEFDKDRNNVIDANELQVPAA